jgi:hypothetical protein
MNSKVKVVADATTGAVINQSSNPDYGYVRLEQVRTLIDDNGFLRRKVISTLIHGTLEELQESGFYAGQELPGTIVIAESLEPFNKTNPDRDLKIAGETGIVCRVGGQPIYRKTKYTPVANAADTPPIQHDNVDELREAYARANASATKMSANTEFDSI